MAAMAKELFISYGREEGVREFAKKLKSDLEENGVSVWLDVDDIPTGSDFHVEIGVALKSCRALVAILTRKYVHSRYCKGELYVANSQEKVLLPVIYEDGWNEGEEGAGVNYIVAAYNWAFFRPNRDDYQESLEKLVHGIKLKLRGSKEQPKVDLTEATTSPYVTSMASAIRNLERWQELGHQLDIEPDKLSQLLHSGKSVAECRDEMIGYWEKGSSENVSWEKLARALSRMGENKLAEQIIDEHVKKIGSTASPLDKQVKQASSNVVSQTELTSITNDGDENPMNIDTNHAPGESDADVSAQIEEFEERFEKLEFASLTELEDKQLDLKRFRHSLVLLPAKIKKEHATFLKENLPTISKAESIDEIFLQLNLHWNFIDYSLLEHIVGRFCSEDLKKDMAQYISDLEAFRKSTTISQMIRSWPGRLEPPPHFSRVTCKLDRDASTYTLHELNQLRVSFCHEFSLSDSIMMLHSFIAGSVVVVWLIPSGSVCDLRMELIRQGSVNPTFFEDNAIARIDVDESSAYLYMPYTEMPTSASPTSEKHSNYYFSMTHSLHSWLYCLDDLTLKSVYIYLSSNEIDALAVDGEPNEQHREALAALEKRLDQAMVVCEGEGAMVHLDQMSVKDALLQLNDSKGLPTGRVHDAIKYFMEFESNNPDPYSQSRAPSSSDIDDNNENKVLRAFQRALNSQYRVSDGRSALNLIGHSKKIKHHLNQVRHFSDLDSSDVQFNLKVTKWNDVIAQYPGMEFRAFVHRNILQAVSQADPFTYYPYVSSHKSTIRSDIEEFFVSQVLPKMKDLENYVVDLIVAKDKIYVMKLHPLNSTTSPGLFTWPELTNLFASERQLEFRTVTTAKTMPDVFGGIEPSFASMLEYILLHQKHHLRHHEVSRRKYAPRRKHRACVLS